MKTLILSNGRSGSKFITQQVMKIYEFLGLQPELVFEPLMWSDKVIARGMKNLDFDFANLDQNAISFHTTTPIYDVEQFDYSKFIAFVKSRIDGKPNLVAKFNRGLGRVNLLFDNFHWDKIIYLYNNPISVLSRLIEDNYNLDGTPHHKSNFNQFIVSEIIQNEQKVLNILKNKDLSPDYKNLTIWYLQNNYLINQIENRNQANLFLFNLDAFKFSVQDSLTKLYRFFGAEFNKENSIELLSQNFTFNTHISDKEIMQVIAKDFVPKYIENLDKLCKEPIERRNFDKQLVNKIANYLDYIILTDTENDAKIVQTEISDKTTVFDDSECLISIIIPTYNRETQLRLCLDAIAKQTFNLSNVEVIVVEDGSSQPSEEMLKSKDYNFELHYIFQANSGPATARNAGIRQAKGKYLLFLNDDAILEPNAVELHYKSQIKLSNYKLAVLGNFKIEKEFAKTPFGYILDNSNILFNYTEYKPYSLNNYENFYTCNLSISKQAVLDVGLFDENFRLPAAEDIELGYRLEKMGYSVYYNPDIVAWHHHEIGLESFYKIFNTRGFGHVQLVLKYDELNYFNLETRKSFAIWKDQWSKQLEMFDKLKDSFSKIKELLFTPNSTELCETIKKDLLQSLKFVVDICFFQGIMSNPEHEKLPKADVKKPTENDKVFLKLHKVTSLENNENDDNLVSIVIPCFNLGKYLEDAVKSIINQTVGNFEIIIVNDGSTDNTKEIAESLCKQYIQHNIQLFNIENSGQPAIPRNIGIERSKGNFIICLDADDKLSRNYIQKCLKLLKSKPELSIVYTDQQNFGANNSFHNHPEYCSEFLKRFNFITTAAMFRKQAWLDTGGYKTNVPGYEDWDFWLNCSSKGHHAQRLAFTLWYYRIREDGLYSKQMKEDLKLKAQVVINNENLYSKKQIQWAKSIIEGKAPEEQVKLNAGFIPDFDDSIDAFYSSDYFKNREIPKKFKILFTMYGWNESGGGTQFPKAVAKNLAKLGFDVAVFYAAGRHPHNNQPYYLEASIENDLVLYAVYNRATVFLDELNPLREIKDKNILELFNVVLDTFAPDVIHYHNFLGLSFAIADLAKNRNIPSVFTPHNYHLIDPLLYMLRSDLNKWNSVDFDSNSELLKLQPEKANEYQQRCEKAKDLLNNKIDYTLAISKRVKTIFEEFGIQPDSIAVVHQVPENIDTINKLAKPKQTINKPIRFGFIGSVIPLKGLHIIAAASQILDPKDAEINIYGEENPQYMEQLKRIDKKGILKFKGKYSPSDLLNISKEVDAMVVSSIMEEGAGLVVIESLAMKVPIIASNIGGIPEFVKNNINGKLYQYNSINELAGILIEIVNKPELIINWNKNCFIQYDFVDYLVHIIKIYYLLKKQEIKNAEEISLFFDDNIKNPNFNGANMQEQGMNRVTFNKSLEGGFSNKVAKGTLPYYLPNPLMLNLGCGNDIRDGFINIDLFSENPSVVGMDVRKLEFENDSVDLIIASDILEHFSHREIDSVLIEWARVLKPEGELIIRCPSLKLQVKAYFDGKWDADIASYMIFGGQTNPGDYHCVAFDEESIRKHLQNAGFQVHFVEEFDLPQDQGYINLNMTVKAIKPAVKKLIKPESPENKLFDENFEESTEINIPKIQEIKQEPVSAFDGFSFELSSDFQSEMESIEIPNETILENISGIEHNDNNNDLPELNIVWEGSQFVYHSLALINREHCSNIINSEIAELTIIPYEDDQFYDENNIKYRQLAEHDIRFKNQEIPTKIKELPYLWIRHQWPPKAEPPRGARWIIMQPWEFTQLRKDFVEIFNNAYEIWTPSNYSRRAMVDSGIHPNKVQIIPNGIDPKLFTPKGPKLAIPSLKRFKFLFVGGTIYRKGIDILLKAYISTFTNEDDVCLVIKDMGGDSFYKGQTGKQKIDEIRNNPKAPEIFYIDSYLSEDEMAELYRACDVFVCPYRGEGFSLPTLEAMACGLPVMVTEGGATDDFVNSDTGWLIQAEVKSIGDTLDNSELTGEAFLLEPNLLELSKSMKFIYANPALVLIKGMNASYRARTQWTWKKATIKLLSRIDAMYSTQMSKRAESKLPDCEDSSIQLFRANEYFDSGHFEDAKNLYKEIAYNDDLSQKYKIHCLHQIARIEMIHGNFVSAEEYLDSAIADVIEHPDNSYLRAKLHIFKNEWPEAHDILSFLFDNWTYLKFETSIGIALDDLLTDTGEGMFVAGDLENALVLFSEALKFNNENPYACLGAAKCFLAANLKDEAKQMLEWAVKLAPDFDEAFDALEKLNAKE